MPVIQPESPISQDLFDALCKPPVLKEMKRYHYITVFNTLGLVTCTSVAAVLVIKRFC